jgi:osmotically-inducible protein OsmY
MKRHVFGMQFPLVLVVTISCAVFPLVASANPGAVGEPRQEPSSFIDPVVERVRVAVQKEVGDSRFSISIYNLLDTVLLRGEVDSEQTRSQIVSVAGRVSGKPVRDEMKLRPALTDDQIASSLRSALSQEYPQLADRVQVEVRGGVAYLSGDLRNHREIDELLSTALMINGVRDIQSDITLGGRPYGSGRMRVGRRAY